MDIPAIEGSKPQGNFPVHDNVVAKFPQGSKILSANITGSSAWTVLARLDVQGPKGHATKYFIKCARDNAGAKLVEGEYHAMLEMYKTMQSIIPKPHSWGHYRDGSADTYFLLSEFLDMNFRLPDPKKLCRNVIRLHRQSVSPTGKFGFHITTCQGCTPQSVAWESSWTVFFTKLLQHVADLDMKINGYWAEIDMLEQRIYSKVIPRLIGALEKDGRSVKPCLIHGDLWEGNTGTCVDTGQIYIFDSASFYAHNEMEMGQWRVYYNKIHASIYRKTYFRLEKPSAPAEEWDDRNRMYSIYFNIIYSVNHTNNGTAVRQTAYDDMYYLIDKYAPFPEGKGPSRLMESERVHLPSEKDNTADKPPVICEPIAPPERIPETTKLKATLVHHCPPLLLLGLLVPLVPLLFILLAP